MHDFARSRFIPSRWKKFKGEKYSSLLAKWFVVYLMLKCSSNQYVLHILPGTCTEKRYYIRSTNIRSILLRKRFLTVTVLYCTIIRILTTQSYVVRDNYRTYCKYRRNVGQRIALMGSEYDICQSIAAHVIALSCDIATRIIILRTLPGFCRFSRVRP